MGGKKTTTRQSQPTLTPQPSTNNHPRRADSLVTFHFDVVAGYEALFAIQFSAIPIHIVLHVQDLERRVVISLDIIESNHCEQLTFNTWFFLKLSSSSAVALKSCLATASMLFAGCARWLLLAVYRVCIQMRSQINIQRVVAVHTRRWVLCKTTSS